MVSPLVLSSDTREYIHVPVTGNPTLTTPPEMAFTVTPDEPDDDAWHQATWHEGAIRLLIGPAGGATQLLNGQYRIWIRFTAGPERPVRKAGLLLIT
jgi:hypothetical protein